MNWSRDDRGMRWGWIGGFLGAGCWIPILSLVLLFGSDPLGGVLGLFGYQVVLLAVFYLSPWRRPRAPLAVLYVGCLAPIVLMAVFFYWRYLRTMEPAEGVMVGWLGFLPVLLPLFLLIRRLRHKPGEWPDDQAPGRQGPPSGR